MLSNFATIFINTKSSELEESSLVGVIFKQLFHSFKLGILQVTIIIDNQEFEQEFNENQPVPRMITPGGLIFVGGMANVRKHTNGQSTDNLDGSVRTVNTSFS